MAGIAEPAHETVGGVGDDGIYAEALQAACLRAVVHRPRNELHAHAAGATGHVDRKKAALGAEHLGDEIEPPHAGIEIKAVALHQVRKPQAGIAVVEIVERTHVETLHKETVGRDFLLQNAHAQVGKGAVDCGLIDEVGGLDAAMSYLRSRIEQNGRIESGKEPKTDDLEHYPRKRNFQRRSTRGTTETD